MNDHAFDQILNAWMDLGPTRAPERVADAARLEARSTRQMPAALDRWAPRRFPDMNTTVRYVLAAAAVGVAAFIGFNYLVSPNFGSPGAEEPTPTPIPSATPVVLATPAPLAMGPLAPGEYIIDNVITVDIILTVPAGWQKNTAPAAVWTPNSEAHLGFFTVENVSSDPCDSLAPLLDPAVGPTVDDLVTALQDAAGLEVGAPVDATVDGYAGTQLDVTATCSEALLWKTQPVNGKTPVEDHAVVWIVDVDGERLVIAAQDRSGATTTALSDMQTMVDTLQIEP